MPEPPIPYCGAPPSPSDLVGRWNLDPVLLSALLAIWVGYLFFARGRPTARPWAFHVGWAFTSLLLVCPLCPLSVALFSARVGQHMALTMVAAPLVALGMAGTSEASGLTCSPIAAAAAYAAALWYWHAPGPYTVTFHSTPVYWLMHLSLYGSAVWFWRTLLGGWFANLAQTVVASALTAASMGLLAAAITFAGRPLYPPHALSTLVWGMTPLADQQLGGAIMWAPAGAILVGVLLLSLAAAMRRSERDARRPAAAGGF
jgi:putative membrane protein